MEPGVDLLTDLFNEADFRAADFAACADWSHEVDLTG